MTRFEEIICSSETARAFMSVCDVERSGFFKWLYDWQTLATGILAIIAAWWTARFIKKQIAIQQQSLEAQLKRDERDAEQQKKATLIAVPHALVEILDYLKACYRAWETMDVSSKPQPPRDAIKTIMKASAYVDNVSFRSFQELISQLQVFESRLDTFEEKDLESVLNEMLADMATISYLTSRLFEFARFDDDHLTIPYRAPMKVELEHEIFRYLSVHRYTNEGIKQRVDNAMKLRFGPWD